MDNFKYGFFNEIINYKGFEFVCHLEINYVTIHYHYANSEYCRSLFYTRNNNNYEAFTLLNFLTLIRRWCQRSCGLFSFCFVHYKVTLQRLVLACCYIYIIFITVESIVFFIFQNISISISKDNLQSNIWKKCA